VCDTNTAHVTDTMIMQRHVHFKSNTVFFFLLLNTFQEPVNFLKDFSDHLKKFRDLTVVRAPHIPTQYFTQILSNALNHTAYYMYHLL